MEIKSSERLVETIGPYRLNDIVIGDCLEVMAKLPDGCVDVVLCDLPYGGTRCKWDVIIPFKPLWEQYKRVSKDNAAMVLTATQPFGSMLVMSNPGMFRYDIVWIKVRTTGHLNAKKMPLREHESILVFYDKLPTYNPQMVKGRPHLRGPFAKRKKPTSVYGNFSDEGRTYESDEYYPRSVVRFQAEMQSIHPTQKPVALFEYLIKTYSNKGDLVLDNCMGSGTTAVAAEGLGRNFFGWDINAGCVEMALKRLEEDRQKRAQLEMDL